MLLLICCEVLVVTECFNSRLSAVILAVWCLVVPACTCRIYPSAVNHYRY